MANNKNSMTPRDKLMKAVFGKLPEEMTAEEKTMWYDKIRSSERKRMLAFAEELEKMTDKDIERQLAELEKTTDEEFEKQMGDGFHENTMLFIHAMDRRKELEPMIELISARVYFPNDNYKKVFQWALMKAAQWQYEQLMKNTVFGTYFDGSVNISESAHDRFEDSQRVKVVIG